ncbi:cell division protein FtsQ/DivIB [Nocardioides daejeonensis]|uniref:cell division protein FtsQ/DivIB n=1 Tax=Nocardioides daejeonensis TaxID=1046556 RepID=UPI000D748682|nr:FtsQ-type POTRA domain-containing protein [Nocardioides daejeonensis]
MPDLWRRGAVDEETVTRRRFARRQWLRRWLAWRVLLVAALAFTLLGVGIWLVWFSSVLGVSGVEVEGTRTLTAEQVRDAAMVPSGEPLATLDVDAIADRVERLPAVKGADVSRAWPDKVLIRIEERRVVAVFGVGERYRGMDETGTVFRNFARVPSGFPVLRAAGELTAEVRTEGAAVAGALPRQIAKQVEFIELRTIDQIDLHLRDGRTVAWGSAEKSAEKAEVLTVLLKQKATTYDVSVPGRPTTR